MQAAANTLLEEETAWVSLDPQALDGQSTPLYR
jgi:hypothetical protein